MTFDTRKIDADSHHGYIEYGSRHIEYEVHYLKRKTLEIAVLPDTTVEVKAPLGTSIDDIEKRLSNRARWISRQIDWFKQFSPRTPPRTYLGGETHRYLGKQYRLKISSGSVSSIKMVRGYFLVTCEPCPPEQKARAVKSCLDNWYRNRATFWFQRILNDLWPVFAQKGLTCPSLQIRQMNSRWGSLSARNTMTLNLRLIQASRECIEYVITHELCHLRHKDHSSAFYELMERIMPDWEKRKQKLELQLL